MRVARRLHNPQHTPHDLRVFETHRLIEELVRYARCRGCYKVILDCSEANAPFYEKCGLQRKEVQMAQYF